MPNNAAYSKQIEEIGRCSDDFMHWVCNYAWIEDKERGGQVKFELWESQRDILSTFLGGRYVMILKARQLGLTWLTAAYCLWMAIFRVNQLIVVISEKETLAIQFLDRVKFMFDRLPGYMKPYVLKRSTQMLHFGYEEKDNKGNTRISGNNSQIYSSTTTPSGAQSMTVNLLVLDEAALIENIKKIWRSSKPGVDSAKGRIIIISNAIKDGIGWPWFRTLYSDAVKGSAGRIKALFMPWQAHPARGEDFISIQKEEGMDDDDIAMHYPSTVEQALEALTGSYFGTVLTAQKGAEAPKRGFLEEIDEKTEFVERKRGIIHMWREPQGEGWSNRYCVFSDVSEGMGLTESVAYVYDRFDKEFIAKMQSDKIDANDWAGELIKLCAWCGDKPMLGIERSGAGQTTVKEVRKSHYPRVYRERRQGKTGKTVTPNFGLAQTRDNKRLLADLLKKYMKSHPDIIPDAKMLDQASTFIMHPDGSLGKEDETKKDDCVIAAGGCLIVDDGLPEPKKPEVEKKITSNQSWWGWQDRAVNDPWCV